MTRGVMRETRWERKWGKYHSERKRDRKGEKKRKEEREIERPKGFFVVSSFETSIGPAESDKLR